MQFRYPGGKAKIAEDLIEHFPLEGRNYVEPFCGRGNIFFPFKAQADYDTWTINDINTHKFLAALKIIDLDALPKQVTKADYEYWKYVDQGGDIVAAVIEPAITFHGKGYRYGFCDDHYKYTFYRERCRKAQQLLRSGNVQIRRSNYLHLPYNSLNAQDFVYFDPPYYQDNSGTGYNDIDHVELMVLLDGAKFRWAISGYNSDLYLAWLGEPDFTITRNREMAKSLTAVECLWTNY